MYTILRYSASLEEVDDGDTNGFQIGLSDTCRYENRPRELEFVRIAGFAATF